MTKFKLTLAIFACLLVFNCKSQSGWRTGRYYQQRGETTTTCGQVYNVTCLDNWGIQYICGHAQNCRTLVWNQEYYEGYVNIWGPNGWYTQWQEGSYWYCYWNDWTQNLP